MELIYISTQVLENFCRKHPIKWHSKEEANEAGWWNIRPPAMQVFFDLLDKEERLMTQEEYSRQAAVLPMKAGEKNYHDLSQYHRKCFRVRLERQFYVSAIDSLHAWALLVEEGNFDWCELNLRKDVVGKTDLIVYSANGGRVKEFKIALHGPTTKNARKWESRKKKRGCIPEEIYDVRMDLARPKRPGNKRWFCRNDFMKAGVLTGKGISHA